MIQKGYEVIDEGTHSEEPADYPLFGAAAAKDVASGKAQYGVVVCGNGEGICMKVVCIPTNRPVVRKDDDDLIYGTHDKKLAALVAAVKERHEKGQPVLIGTVSVESNEEISALLDKAGVPHAMPSKALKHNNPFL